MARAISPNMALSPPSSGRLVERGARPLDRRRAGRADMDVADDEGGVLQTERLLQEGAVGRREAGQPVRAPARRQRRVQQAIADAARRERLLPVRYLLGRLRRRGDRHHHRALGERVRRLLDLVRVEAQRLAAFPRQRAEPLAGGAFHDEQPPGRELAVIGRAQRRLQQRLQRRTGRPVPAQRLGGKGTAGGEKAHGVARVVQDLGSLRLRRAHRPVSGKVRFRSRRRAGLSRAATGAGLPRVARALACRSAAR
jgi:hypothetical protein